MVSRFFYPMTLMQKVSNQCVLDWYKAWNRRDWEAVAQLLDARFSFEDTALRQCLEGKYAFLRLCRQYTQAFPDGAIDVTRAIHSGAPPFEIITVEYALRGRQDGVFLDFPATHRKVEILRCDVLYFEHQRLMHCRSYGDLYHVLKELEHIPSVTSQGFSPRVVKTN
ncbi:MAG: ester cyclase [Bdellovibrionota bacterium]